MIAPPHRPYAPALAELGINPDGVLIVTPRTERELLWSAEQCLQSGCCGAVLTWALHLNPGHRQLRRLQQAAHRGQCWHVLFRHCRHADQPSPSALRLQLGCSAGGALQVRIAKQRGGWSGQTVSIALQPDLSQLQWLSPGQLPLPQQQYAGGKRYKSRAATGNSNDSVIRLQK